MEGGNFNAPKWDDPTLDELVFEARRAPTRDEQIALFHEALELVGNNSGWIMPYWYNAPFVSKPELKDVGLDTVSIINFANAHFE